MKSINNIIKDVTKMNEQLQLDNSQLKDLLKLFHNKFKHNDQNLKINQINKPSNKLSKKEHNVPQTKMCDNNQTHRDKSFNKKTKGMKRCNSCQIITKQTNHEDSINCVPKIKKLVTRDKKRNHSGMLIGPKNITMKLNQYGSPKWNKQYSNMFKQSKKLSIFKLAHSNHSKRTDSSIASTVLRI